MLNIVAKVVSVIFHPLGLPTAMFFIIFRFVPQAFRPIASETIPHILLVIIATTLIIPMFSILALHLTGIIKSLEMEDRKERPIPFIFITAFYAATTYMFYSKVGLNPVLINLLLVTTALIVLLTIISTFWKISIHSAGLGGVVGFILALVRVFPGSELLLPFVAALLILGLVMAARLHLQAHTLAQVAGGAALGLLFCYTFTLLPIIKG